MTGKRQAEPGHRAISIEVDPHEVDAGAELIVKIRVTSPDDKDFSGQPVAIRNGSGEEIARGLLAENADGDPDSDVGNGAYATAMLVHVPLETGEHVFTAALPAVEIEGVSYPETVTTFSCLAVAHAAQMNMWDLPSAIAGRERFSLKVGIRCSCGCNLAGRPLRLVDHRGEEIAAAVVTDAPWPGTTALYFADVNGSAPEIPGYYDWSVKTRAFDNGKPHAAGAFAFGVRVVATPDAEVTVEAFDTEKQMPIKGIHVLLHPYRAWTDDNGVARIRVARGRYKLVVSGFKYVPYESVIDADRDVTERAELSMEPPGDGYFRP